MADLGTFYIYSTHTLPILNPVDGKFHLFLYWNGGNFGDKFKWSSEINRRKSFFSLKDIKKEIKRIKDEYPNVELSVIRTKTRKVTEVEIENA